MATKTISIDEEAYNRLAEVREDNESFSQAIKRVVRPRPDIEAILAHWDRLSLSTEAADAIEQQIASRRQPSRRRR